MKSYMEYLTEKRVKEDGIDGMFAEEEFEALCSNCGVENKRASVAERKGDFYEEI